MNQTENIQELVGALSKAQGKMEPAKFNKQNPHFKNKYADFTSCMDACRVPLSDNGLSVMQYCETVNDKLTLVTMLAHTSGQWIKSHFPLCPKNMDSQSIGSAMTYAKRYSLSSMLGIVSDEEDDDAEAAHGRGRSDIVSQPARPSCAPKVEVITNDQAAELRSRFVKCSNEFKQRTLLFCKRFHVTESLEALPKEYYERLSLSITKDIHDNREKTTQLQAQA